MSAEIVDQVMALVAAGRAEEARRIADGALRQAPESLGLLNASAIALIMAGRPGKGARRLSGCVVSSPGDGAFLANLANAFVVDGTHAAGAVWFRRALAAGAIDAGSLSGLAVALHAMSRLTEAIELFTGALALDQGSTTALLGRGHSWLTLGRPGEAVADLRRAAVMAPAHAGAWKTLAAVQFALGDHPRTIAAWRRRLVLGPGEPDVFAGLSRAYQMSFRIAESIAAARAGLLLAPGHAPSWDALGSALLSAGATVDARRSFAHALACDPAEGKYGSNLLFALAYDETLSNPVLFAAFRAWELRHAVSIYARASHPRPSETGGGRLVVGYVSAEFRDHPIAQLTEGLFAHHDRRIVSVHGYANVENPDAVTRRLAQACDRWRSIAGIGDEAAADLIRADGVDILVMLGAHTGQNRPIILAHRPAPLQAVMHDLSTSGMRFVDLWLTDRILHPPETTEGHTEELVRLPSLYLHSIPGGAPAVSALPSPGAGFVTFGSFSTPAKLNIRVLRLWARILRAVPRSRLMVGHNAAFADRLVAARFRSLCAAAGLPFDRVDLAVDRVGREAHLARVGSLDIALDPFPFNGGITTFEALWMGVPVVTLEGQRFAARGCASHLVQVGLEHLVAPTEDAYVETAVGLAESPEALAALRGSLRRRVLSSPLCDAPTYAAALEQALLGRWLRRYPAWRPSG